MTEVSVVVMTAPSEDVAASIAKTLVEEGLIACANLVPRVRSIYRWEGATHDEAETLVMMKTATARLARLVERVKALHPYSVPEVLELAVRSGSQPYLDWVLAETRLPAER